MEPFTAVQYSTVLIQILLVIHYVRLINWENIYCTTVCDILEAGLLRETWSKVIQPRCTLLQLTNDRIAENLCQVPGTGLYLDVLNHSPSSEITLL